MISTEAEGVRVRCLGIPMPEPVPACRTARATARQSSDGLRGMGRESIVDRVDREK